MLLKHAVMTLYGHDCRLGQVNEMRVALEWLRTRGSQLLLECDQLKYVQPIGTLPHTLRLLLCPLIANMNPNASGIHTSG